MSRWDVPASVSAVQPPVWTFLEFEADDAVAGPLAESLARSLLAEGGWYADFRAAMTMWLVRWKGLPLSARRPGWPGWNHGLWLGDGRPGTPAGLARLTGRRAGWTAIESGPTAAEE